MAGIDIGRGDPHHALDRLRLRRRRQRHPFGRRPHLAQRRHQLLPRLGQHQASPHPLEDHQPQALLQRRHLPPQRWLGQAQPLGRC